MRGMLGYLRASFGVAIPPSVEADLAAAPVSMLERLEHRVRTREHRLLGELPTYVFNCFRGEPRPVLTGVFATGGGLGAGIGSAQVAFATNGTAVYVSGQPAVDSALKLAVVDRNGRTLYEYPEVRAFRDPAFSRDGQRVFVRVGDGKSEHIHVLDLSRGTLTRIIFEGGFSGVPTMALRP